MRYELIQALAQRDALHAEVAKLNSLHQAISLRRSDQVQELLNNLHACAGSIINMLHET